MMNQNQFISRRFAHQRRITYWNRQIQSWPPNFKLIDFNQVRKIEAWRLSF
jgi:hypothetical protein